MSESRQPAEKQKRTRSRTTVATAKTRATDTAATAERSVAAEPSKAPRRRAPTAAAIAAKARTDGATAVTADERHGMIAQCAYYRAQSRGWVAGAELEDWLDAERQVDALLAGRRPD